MITCKNCHHEELNGAIFCSQCGAQFVDTADTTIYPAGMIKSSGIAGNTAPEFPSPPAEFSESTVALYLIDAGEIIFLPIQKNITVGRSTEGQLVIPDIDLTAFDAYEAGVSRLHANITLQSNPASIKDLGSANGTRINGQRTTAHTEYAIKHGDILTLGKLKAQILIKETEA